MKHSAIKLPTNTVTYPHIVQVLSAYRLLSDDVYKVLIFSRQPSSR